MTTTPVQPGHSLPSTRPPGWSLKAVARVSLIALSALPALPVQMLIVRFAPSRSQAIPQWFHRLVCRVRTHAPEPWEADRPHDHAHSPHGARTA